MIRFAKILEIDAHQFLIRACHHPALAMLPELGEKQYQLLTIDTETREHDEPHMMRMVVNCQRADLLEKCFAAFDEGHCLEVLKTLLDERMGLLSQQDMIEATNRLQQLLLQAVTKQTP